MTATRPGRPQLLKALRAVARPEKAEGMQRYLKSELPCLGVQVPEARRIAKALFSAPFPSLDALSRWVEGLWNEAGFREERFVALNVLRLKAHREHLTAKAAPLLERLIRSGAWWDLVDELSAHVVRVCLENDPAAMTKVVRGWAQSQELWLQRAALVCQVVRGAETDLALLEVALEHAVDGRDFFLRKGIGWALRAAAKHHAPQVRAWLKQYASRLSPLSVREASRGLRNREDRRVRAARLRRAGERR